MFTSILNSSSPVFLLADWPPPTEGAALRYALLKTILRAGNATTTAWTSCGRDGRLSASRLQRRGPSEEGFLTRKLPDAHLDVRSPD